MEKERQYSDKDPINIELAAYYKRKEDGEKATQYMMAKLRKNSIDNSYPREVNKQIEEAFEQVTIATLRGWWITAKEKCELVVIDGVYVTQELYDDIYTQITTYIAQNY